MRISLRHIVYLHDSKKMSSNDLAFSSIYIVIFWFLDLLLFVGVCGQHIVTLWNYSKMVSMLENCVERESSKRDMPNYFTGGLPRELISGRRFVCDSVHVCKSWRAIPRWWVSSEIYLSFHLPTWSMCPMSESCYRQWPIYSVYYMSSRFHVKPLPVFTL